MQFVFLYKHNTEKLTAYIFGALGSCVIQEVLHSLETKTTWTLNKWIILLQFSKYHDIKPNPVSEKSNISFAEGMNIVRLSVEPVSEHLLYKQYCTVYTVYTYILYVSICY